MSTVIGGIEIRMLADLASLKRDMDQAKGLVGSASKSMQAGADVIKGAFIGIASGLSVAAFVSWMRSAIDAADATKAFAQKTGIAAKDVAGLQLAFKQGGVSSDQFTVGMGKLQKQMVDGNKTFAALGIETRNVDGSMRTTKDVLYDTANAFAGMRDGAAKSAAAIDIFGKAGVEMIPTLNEGAEGLSDMADMAAKLGLVIDSDTAEAADRFNDTAELLGLGLQGIARQAMAQLLPALSSVAGGFLQAMTSGDTLRQVSDVLATGMKGLFTLIMGGAQIVNTFGKTLGALGAQLAALASGDFRGMMDVGKAWMDDIKGDWSTTIKSVGSVWDGSAGQSVQAMAKVTATQRDMAVQTDKQDAAAQKAADSAAKQAAELRKLSAAGRDYLLQQMDKNDATQTEIDLGRSLTAAEIAQLDLTRKLADGKLLMSAATEASTRAEIALAGQLAANKQWLKDTAAENAAAADAVDKKTAAIIAETEKQREANEVIGLSADRIGALKVARLLEMAAAADKKAQWEEEFVLVEGVTSAQRDLAQAYRDAAGVAETGAHLAAAKEAADAWQKTADDIGQGLTDSLFRAFEAGRGFFSTLWDGIKNLFRTTVLKLAIQPLQTGMTSAIGGMLGMGSSGASAAGGGSGSLLSAGASMLGSLGTFGTAAGYGASALFGGTGLTALSSGASMVGAGSLAGGLGMMAGVLGPVAVGLMALTSLLKDKDAKLGFGAATVNASGAITGAGRQFGFGRGDDIGSQGQLVDLSKAILGGVASAAASFGGSSAGLTLQAATDIDRKGKGSGILGFMRGGSMVSAVQTGGTNNIGPGGVAASKIDAGQLSDWFAGAGSAAIIAGLQASDLAPRFKEYFGSVAAYSLTKEQADSMLSTASAVQGMADMLTPLGGVFARVGGLGIEATAGMVALTGGLDQFLSKASQYVANFYSADEQAAISAAGIQRTLSAAGIDAGALDSKEAFRALVDSTNINTETGRAQLAALLNTSAEFASLGVYLAEQGKTLAQVADTAPQIAMLEQSTSQTALAQQSVDGLFELNMGIGTLGDRITASLDSVRASFEAGLAAVAEATAATSRRLDSWDDGGSIITSTGGSRT